MWEVFSGGQVEAERVLRRRCLNVEGYTVSFDAGGVASLGSVMQCMASSSVLNQMGGGISVCFAELFWGGRKTSHQQWLGQPWRGGWFGTVVVRLAGRFSTNAILCWNPGFLHTISDSHLRKRYAALYSHRYRIQRRLMSLTNGQWRAEWMSILCCAIPLRYFEWTIKLH